MDGIIEAKWNCWNTQELEDKRLFLQKPGIWYRRPARYYRCRHKPYEYLHRSQSDPGLCKLPE